MEIIFVGWILALIGTLLTGYILLLVIAALGKHRRCIGVRRIRQLLWICPKRINEAPILDIFFIIIFEILFGVEMVLGVYSLVVCEVEEIGQKGAWCGNNMFIYAFVSCVYIAVLSNYIVRKNGTTTCSKKISINQVRMRGSVKIGGGGLFRPLLKGMILLSTVVFFLFIKSFFMTVNNRQGMVKFILISSVLVLFIVWMVLIVSGKVKKLIVKEDELIYKNWYGKQFCCFTDEIQKVELVGCNIILWMNEREIFAKFNNFTEGFEKILEDD